MSTPETFDAARFANICTIADERARALFGTMKDMKGRGGAYYCAGDVDGVPIATIGIGKIGRDKRHKYKRICEKKVAEAAFLQRYGGKTRSRDCVDDDLERYIGGIAVADGAYGVSGYMADVDECLSVTVAHVMGEIDEQRAEQLLWDNPLKTLGMQLLREVATAAWSA